MHRKICTFIAVMAFVILSASCAFGEVAIDEEHFPDPTFRAYVMIHFDKDRDGILNDNEIASATGIYLSDWRWKWDDPYDHIWYVKSLKGIEYLTALKQIDCSDNGLTQLDVSKNIMLQYLNCIGSRLTTLNIGSHPTLKTLLCENNLLSSINIGNCPALIELYCKDNRLSSLNVSSCPALTRLDCSCNRLVSLNLCKSAFFERFNCSYNKIQELDVRTNRFDGNNGGMYISTNDINGHDFTRVYMVSLD